MTLVIQLEKVDSWGATSPNILSPVARF